MVDVPLLGIIIGGGEEEINVGGWEGVTSFS